MPRSINDAGLEIIMHFEGVHDGDRSTPLLEPMLDPVGIPTLGYGAIYDGNGDRVTMETPAISVEEAEELLRRDLGRAENAVARSISVPLTDNQFSALVSFTYNVGSGNLRASTLRQHANREEFEEAADEFPKWRRSRGVILPGLVRRRRAERALWLAA